MAKVKKRRAGKDGDDRDRPSASNGRGTAGGRVSPTSKRTAAASRAAARTGKQTRTTESTAPRVVKIRELDPQGKCGAGTSVTQLYRVDEWRDGTPATHLVFFDRHGWYCEHGRGCPAVDDVRKNTRYGLIS